MSVNPAMYATHTISADAGADDFCDAVRMHGSFDVSVYGATWAGTIRLQRYIGGGWKDVDTYTANTETRVNDSAAGGHLYRIGQQSGDYTSGSVTMILEG